MLGDSSRNHFFSFGCKRESYLLKESSKEKSNCHSHGKNVIDSRKHYFQMRFPKALLNISHISFHFTRVQMIEIKDKLIKINFLTVNLTFV